MSSVNMTVSLVWVSGQTVAVIGSLVTIPGRNIRAPDQYGWTKLTVMVTKRTFFSAIMTRGEHTTAITMKMCGSIAAMVSYIDMCYVGLLYTLGSFIHHNMADKIF